MITRGTMRGMDGLRDQTEGSASFPEREQGPWEATAKDAAVGGGPHSGLRRTRIARFGWVEKG